LPTTSASRAPLDAPRPLLGPPPIRPPYLQVGLQSRLHVVNRELQVPLIVPTLTVPYFDLFAYNFVNLDATFSAFPSGIDLPTGVIFAIVFLHEQGHCRYDDVEILL
jgi:hypothetical protein